MQPTITSYHQPQMFHYFRIHLLDNLIFNSHLTATSFSCYLHHFSLYAIHCQVPSISTPVLHHSMPADFSVAHLSRILLIPPHCAFHPSFHSPACFSHPLIFSPWQFHTPCPAPQYLLSVLDCMLLLFHYSWL